MLPKDKLGTRYDAATTEIDADRAKAYGFEQVSQAVVVEEAAHTGFSLKC